jgi:two-component system, LytTR family, sensor kinase
MLSSISFMRNRITWLGIIFSVMIPAMGILSRNGPSITPEQIPAIWGILSCFLAMIWFINFEVYVRYLYRYRVRFYLGVLVIAACDALIVLLFFTLVYFDVFPVTSSQYSIFDFSLLIRFTFGITLVSVIQYMFISVNQQERLRRKNAQLRIENLVAELEGLKQQINPHFLFNSLATLQGMIHEKDENAEQYVLSLSAVYRQFLSKRNETTTTLREELMFLENYLYMLRYRYEECLQLTFDVKEKQTSLRLPVFCLQLLVENCIKHNILSSKKPLLVRIYQSEPGSITVENNKQPKQTDTESMGIGLTNLQQRYKLLGLSNAVMVHQTDTQFAVTVTLLAS